MKQFLHSNESSLYLQSVDVHERFCINLSMRFACCTIFPYNFNFSVKILTCFVTNVCFLPQKRLISLYACYTVEKMSQKLFFRNVYSICTQFKTNLEFWRAKYILIKRK